MAEVKSLFGGEIPQPGALPTIVEMLQNLLAEAKAGNVRCLAVAYIDSGDCVCTKARRGDKWNHQLAGAIAYLQHDFMSALNEQQPASGNPDQA